MDTVAGEAPTSPAEGFVPEANVTPNETSAPVNDTPTTEPPAENTQSTETPAEEPTKFDPYAWLAEQDPDEIVKRAPKLQGKLGELADKRSRQLLAEEQSRQDALAAQLAAKAEQERRDSLLETNPYEYAEEVKRDRERQAQEGEFWEKQANPIFDGLFKRLPPEAQASLAGKAYYGTPAAARTAYLSDVVDAIAGQMAARMSTDAVAKAQVEWEKGASAKAEKREAAVREAERKRVLSEINGGDPSPEVSGGQSAGGLAMTQGEYDRIRDNYAEVNKPEVKARINLGVSRKLITH